MRRLPLRIITPALAILLGSLIFLLWQSYRPGDLLADTEPISDHSASSGDLSLTISAENTSTKVGEHPVIRASISNKSAKTLTLVKPGDGSESGWRTPVIRWSIAKIDEIKTPHDPAEEEKIARCGNINTLGPDEIFRLAPGEAQDINEWLSLRPFPKPGVYAVRLVYENDPSLKWGGIPLGEHDPSAMEQVEQSTKCRLVSNQITLTVTR